MRTGGQRAKQLRIEAFVEAYIGPAGFHLAAAAQAAGYSGSDKQLTTRGSELLKDPLVTALIRRRIREKSGVTINEVLTLMAQHLRGDMTNLLTTEGEVTLDLEAARAGQHLGLIRRFWQRTRTYLEGRGTDARAVTETAFSIELHDRQEAAEFFARHLGMFRAERKSGRVGSSPMSIDQVIDRLIDLGVSTSKWEPELVRHYEARQAEAGEGQH
jgi:hypothetical protein